MSRAFSKILVLVILIVLAGGGIFAWQYLGVPKEELPKDETADWKVYKNEKYQYEIKYPPELDLGELEKEFEKWGKSIETANVVTWDVPETDPLKIVSIRTIVDDNPNQKSLLSLLGYKPASCKIEKEQDTFVKISCKEEIEGGGLFFFIGSAYSQNGRAYIITLEIAGEDFTEADFADEINTYNLMLSTFNFLEGEVVASPQRSAKDIKVMSDMSQIGAAAEIFYSKNGSYLNLASDEDVYNLQKQIQNEIYRWPGMITSDDSYCVDVTLSNGRTKYCIDSEGRRGENLGCSSTRLICISY